jgi:general nucleoside transport system ATP-binding protein
MQRSDLLKKNIEMKNITKIFPGTIANDNVDFDICKGETHVLLGENGAGKSTLMNILYGLYQPEKGTISVDGTLRKIKNPREAIELGIGMVHQHFMLVHNLTVTQNIILGQEPKNGFNIDYKKALKDVSTISSKYGFDIDPNETVENLSVGKQQKVEILKALYRGAKTLILDEPTAVLTPQEVDELSLIIDNLKKQGKSIILITHKLKEVMSMSDRITVLRRGIVTGSVDKNEISIDGLVEMMIGEKMDLRIQKEKNVCGEEVLSVENITIRDHRDSVVVDDLSFKAYASEILGIAGVAGNGQNEVAGALAGIIKVEKGKMVYQSKVINKQSTKNRIANGMSFIPEDRHKRGLILSFSLFENAILGMHNNTNFNKGLTIKYNEVKEFCAKLIDKFDIRCSGIDAEAKTLSGGNQQKLVVARELSKNPNLLVASQPTRGVDIGAIDNIHKQLLAERDNGKAVILISSELDEILALSDKIAVIYKGKIIDTLDRSIVTEQMLGLLMAGGSHEKHRRKK